MTGFKLLMFFLSAASVLLAVPAKALPFADYVGCTKLADSDPARALQEAEEWKRQGGSHAAEHCLILALSKLKRFGEAAARLEYLAAADTGFDYRKRAQIYEEAGAAWMQTGQLNKAEQAFDTGLKLMPDDLELHAGRARARAMNRDWAGVLADLDAALKTDQNRVDLLVLRARAFRALKKRNEAATDILRALTVFPDYPAALVERAIMKMEVGDQQGARQDWEKAAAGKDGAAAITARRYLSMFGS